MHALTQKQKAVLAFIQTHWRKNDAAPSFDEIRGHFGFASPNAVTKHLRALEKKGFLRDRKKGRKYEHRAIVPLALPGVEIPVLGDIAAGQPIEAIENIETKVDLSPLGISNTRGDYFILHVKGSSMINAHIVDGDMVIIRQQDTVSSSEIAAVVWNNEATLKYVKHKGGNIILEPANDNMVPITVSPERTLSLRILGKYVGLIRKQ